MHMAFTQHHQNAITIFPLTAQNLAAWLSQQPRHVQHWVTSSQFTAESDTFCIVPNHDGSVQCVVLGMSDADDFWSVGALPPILPAGHYTLDANSLFTSSQHFYNASLAWGLGYYQFTKYKTPKPRKAKLIFPTAVNQTALENMLAAITLSRDLINTPAQDMNPSTLEAAVKQVAKQFSAVVTVITGEKLLKENYPTVHAVGRASYQEPRVIDLRWGKKNAPRVTLVGKGVCFDSGGLDLKTAAGMLLMKKDMAGSAMMLSLAQLIMSHNLPVQLRVLIGAVENAVSGNSYHPGDIIKTRSGKTVEITNTDAEGRMVLCDLLFEACTESPDVLIDFATLTGAARIALGEDLPALYAQPQSFADNLLQAAKRVNDPLWQMPLVANYRNKLKSEIADMVNAADSSYGGSITAALFLQAFVTEKTRWAHVDAAAWNFQPRSGRPVGGEAYGVRAVFEYLIAIYNQI